MPKIDEAATYLLRALVIKQGVTSALGAPAGLTIIDASLVGVVWVPSNMTVVIWPGVPLLGEARPATSINPITGAVGVLPGFTAQVPAGTPYVLLAFGPSQGLLNAIQASLAVKQPFLDCPSLSTTPITVPAVAADLAFPDVVVAGIPAGATVTRAIATLLVNAIQDTSAAQNQISVAARTLRIKTLAGAWPGTVCITFPLNAWRTLASGFRGGVAVPGDTDVSAIVTGNGTYNFASRQTGSADALVATGASLLLLDVQILLRVYFV